ncbi:MAG: ankyrin repeat domain-containing protein [Pseudomonadota bacterium]
MTKKQPKRTDRPGVDRLGRTPLHYAAAERNGEDVSRLLSEGANVNARDDNEWSPLHFATQSNSVQVVSQLLAAKADVNAVDSNGNSPLSNAVFNSGGDGSVIAILREAGADPYLKNAHGVSPIELAHNIGNYDVARFFSDLPWPGV